ncbi:SUMF1/EgtB/PvdO family nonheme iron enzyme [Photobacterium sp. WH24]|uniref:SUMF1/EgtB/PvdO family nonheme iron enzyme n=1 Tax=Photobacterium arenosum TaxID=2774143 RepID=A0ABR9BME6_9GAMM|nr:MULTISPECIES: SUMF1/EgtB/PvdO family nonheme iron enzyme [Photobacterium]MBD8513657.1 SUMF1/EgtB/PvdO family nonheme iron enzyme [Photobacterium arenosum]MBV7264519.1 SUMF1/EgtB/PvdO family nonheme iron enzyme [Photobacterium sp. WH24]
MNIYRLGLACTLPLLAACNDNNSPIKITSETVSQQQLDTIVTNIEKRYPEATQEQKQNAADVVVRAIENLVFVEGGSFEMGDFRAPCDIPSRTENRMDWTPEASCLSSPGSAFDGSKHLHPVTLDSYSISKFETSFMDMEWMRQINRLPVARNKLNGYMPVPGEYLSRSDEEYKKLIKYHTKHTVATGTKSWQEAKDYCLWLGEISALPIDLPTEAQWEFAARSRGQHKYYATNNGYLLLSESIYFDPELNKYIEVSDSEINSSTAPEKNLGDFPPNPLGIYGMSNNRPEWVNDWYDKDYYLQSPVNNPQGPDSGEDKVMRDGFTFGRIDKSPNQDFYVLANTFRCVVKKTDK